MLWGLRAAAPTGVTVDVFDGVARLPVFSPDLEGDRTPAAVQTFIEMIDQSDGVIVASPEYVRAIPGGLKNAIDWLVSGEAIIHKPVALAHASHRGDDMLASLRLVLGTVTSRFATDVFMRFPLVSKDPDEVQTLLELPENHAVIAAYLDAFVAYLGAE